MPLHDFARAVHVPLGTLKDWLAGGREAIEADMDVPNLAAGHERLTHGRLAEVLAAYAGWDGSFVDFCAHVQHHLRIPFSRALLGGLLEAEGLRPRRRRPGRRDADAEALRGTFQTFCSGAQAVADGTQLSVQVGDETFTFNVELVVDAHTAAWTGLAVTPTEDAAAVIAALDDAHRTTGQHPIAVLLDNKPSNHAPDVRDALAEHDTLSIRATPGRPENKAHVEGAFGLFKVRCPELVLDPTEPAALARQLVELVVVTFARVLNHRPRPERDDRSRVQQFEQDRPSDAERAPRDRPCRRVPSSRSAPSNAPAPPSTPSSASTSTKPSSPSASTIPMPASAPRSPATPPTRSPRASRSSAPSNSAAPCPTASMPATLLGIVRNTAQQDEGFAIADALWRERLALRDRALNPLARQRDRLEHEHDDLEPLLVALVEGAMAADRRLDRAFWLRAAADLLRDFPIDDRRPLFRIAARRIHATHGRPHRQRLAATRRLAAMALPLDA